MMLFKRTYISLTILCIVLFLSAPLQSAEPTSSGVDAVNAFAFDLYKKIGQTDQNFVMSPYGLSSVLTILAKGAAGPTRTQLLHLLHSDNKKQGPDNGAPMLEESCLGWFHCHMMQAAKSLGFGKKMTVLLDANALWADKNFVYKQSFLDLLAQDKSVQFYQVNYSSSPESARNTINHWVEDKTQDYIKNLIPQNAITTATKLVLVNAIYFNGLWELPFKSENTAQKPFQLANGQFIQIPMMSQLDYFYFAENDKLQLLRLPYSGSTLEMAVVLPKPSHTMQEIRQGLSPEAFSKLLQVSSRQRVKVSLPKFKLESTLSNIIQTFQRMGLTDAFSEKANFSNMTNSVVEISGVFQKAVIQVDEKGTVATAATGTVMFGAVSASMPVEFNVNHPFVFVLYDTKTGYILFMGHVIHP